jgi:hypothetical protein
MTSVQQQALRDDPAHVLPEDLPREFRQFDTPVTMMGGIFSMMLPVPSRPKTSTSTL